MNPTTDIHLAEGASLEMETVQIKGIDSTERTTTAEVAPAILPIAASWIRFASMWFAVSSGIALTLASSIMMASHSLCPWQHHDCGGGGGRKPCNQRKDYDPREAVCRDGFHGEHGGGGFQREPDFQIGGEGTFQADIPQPRRCRGTAVMDAAARYDRDVAVLPHKEVVVGWQD